MTDHEKGWRKENRKRKNGDVWLSAAARDRTGRAFLLFSLLLQGMNGDTPLLPGPGT